MKKEKPKYKPYMTKAAVILPAIREAFNQYTSKTFLAADLSEVATKAAVKALRDYENWLAKGGS